MKNRTADILCEVESERIRQIEAEGFDAAHDDRHDDGALIKAAICYAYESGRTEHQRALDANTLPMTWPWHTRWWKPKNPRRDLIRAIALLVAEVERRDRCAQPQGQQHE